VITPIRGSVQDVINLTQADLVLAGKCIQLLISSLESGRPSDALSVSDSVISLASIIGVAAERINDYTKKRSTLVPPAFTP